MLSQTIEYALRALSHIAVSEGLPATCKSIARSTRVPRSYLSKILRDLVNAGLLQSFRGPHGGFTLARDATCISVLDIINAVEPIRHFARCPLERSSKRSACTLHQCLDDAVTHLERSLGRATLAACRSARPCPWVRPPADQDQGDRA